MNITRECLHRRPLSASAARRPDIHRRYRKDTARNL
jgi:hypothetical protein